MKTVNSLSGGKSSSYIAVHYPADHDIFSLVCIDDHNAGKRIDKGIKREVNARLSKYCSNWPEFKATSEDPKVLKAMLDLEQLIGREIIWVRGIGWEKMMMIKKAVPNRNKRFCTTIMKMWPVFEWCYLYSVLPVRMRIGYRYDEKERAKGFDENIHYPLFCQFFEKSAQWKHRWRSIKWREGEFVLIDDKVTHYKVHTYWEKQNIDWPLDSNCQNCFWKAPQQLRMNYETNPDIMKWAMAMEGIHNHTFKDDYSIRQISNMGIQLDFFYGTGAGCSASGFCSN